MAGFDIALQDYKTVFVCSSTRRIQVEASKYKPASANLFMTVSTATISGGRLHLAIDSQVFEQTIDNIHEKYKASVLVKEELPRPSKNIQTFGKEEVKLAGQGRHLMAMVFVAVQEHYVFKESLVNAIVMEWVLECNSNRQSLSDSATSIPTISARLLIWWIQSSNKDRRRSTN